VPTIRPATPADAQGATGVVREAFEVYVERMGGLEPWPMTLDYAALIEAGDTWVAQDDGEVVGVLVLEPHEDHLLLEIVAVAPSVQGSGVGTLLLDLADSETRSRSLGEVRLFTNALMTENLAYYPRHGYVETHRDQVGPFHRVFFVKRL
jgi:predicted N-acetyltransferase YhbS